VLKFVAICDIIFENTRADARRIILGDKMKAIQNIQDFDSRIKRVLITKEQIAEAVAEAGKWIDSIYDGRPILLVSILKGAFVFMADICRVVSVPCEVGFMCAKSYYEGTTSSGVVKITMDLDRDISGYHVVIVEDIIDTGRTLNDIMKILQARAPLSLWPIENSSLVNGLHLWSFTPDWMKKPVCICSTSAVAAAAPVMRNTTLLPAATPVISASPARS
jgi:hypoxanthine phosphoribosyltransferase